MSSLSCRLLPFQVADGAWNMAADEAILHSAAAGIASLRFYGWQTPTMSLGYFQAAAVCQAYPGLANLPVIRRASGGATLVHHHEVTYALALPASWQGNLRPGETWTGRMHGVIAKALSHLGVVPRLCLPEEEAKHGEVLCFLHHTKDDLLLNGHKIAGSAQRKQKGALVQHGGILLSQSPYTPELPGIAELAGVTLNAIEVARKVEAGLVLSLDCQFVPGDWLNSEKEHIEQLIHTRYANPAWTNKR